MCFGDEDDVLLCALVTKMTSGDEDEVLLCASVLKMTWYCVLW